MAFAWCFCLPKFFGTYNGAVTNEYCLVGQGSWEDPWLAPLPGELAQPILLQEHTFQALAHVKVLHQHWDHQYPCYVMDSGMIG
jgi:hypothetical protein